MGLEILDGLVLLQGDSIPLVCDRAHVGIPATVVQLQSSLRGSQSHDSMKHGRLA